MWLSTPFARSKFCKAFLQRPSPGNFGLIADTSHQQDRQQPEQQVNSTRRAAKTCHTHIDRSIMGTQPQGISSFAFSAETQVGSLVSRCIICSRLAPLPA